MLPGCSASVSDAMLNIAIYRRHLLALSEGFILNQAEALAGFRPYYFGLRRVTGLELPRGRSFTVSQGGAAGRIKEQMRGSGAIINHARSIEPVLVHAHFGPAAITGLRVARELGVPLVVTFH